MNDVGRQTITLDDIEEHETARWIDEQLDRIERLVREHGADDEMLEAISYLREDNASWVSPEVEELDRSGRLLVPREGGDGH